MKGTTFAQIVRKYTGTNSTTLTDADLVLFANIEKDALAELITEKVAEDYFKIGFQRDLEAGVRECSLPNELLLHLKRVSAKLDGSTWSLLTERDENQIRLPLVTEENITRAYAGRKPQFDILDRGIKIYSEDAIIAVTDGLEIEAMMYPSDIVAGTLALSTDLSVPTSTITTALPRAAHEIWAMRTSIAYKQSRPKPIPLNAKERAVEGYTQRMLDNLNGRNLDQSIVPNTPVDNGFNY